LGGGNRVSLAYGVAKKMGDAFSTFGQYSIVGKKYDDCGA
jgi:hypothetical protein